MTCHGWPRLVCLILLLPLLAGCRTGAPDFSPERMLDAASPDTAERPASPSQVPAIVRRDHAVVGASYMQPNDELPVPPEPDSVSANPPESIATPTTLELQEVIVSVQEKYPLFVSALLERQVADGKQLSAWGEFDLKVKAESIAGPEGFYKTYRNRIALEQPIFKGGYLYGGYKIGDGNFQPWFGERETNEGGEFSAGFGVPLLKGRTIDKRRAALFQADLARDAVEPAIRAQLLEFVRVASQAYWKWVAAGQMLEAERQLLKLAQARVNQIEERVKAGDLGRIAQINNDQLIASRETKVIEYERKLQEAGIKLSLFLRNDLGQPVIPDQSQLPRSFPEHSMPNPDQLDAEIRRAVAARPELVELELIAEQVRVELAQLDNSLLPKVDARLLASKDVGAPASKKGDKTPFELEVGLYGELPLQRRASRGKIEAARGKLTQIKVKQEYVANKVTALVQDAVSALQAAAGRIERARTNLRLARETLALGRDQFNAGDIGLIDLNIYENAATDAQLRLIVAQADFFAALADYRAALSLDPLGTTE